MISKFLLLILTSITIPIFGTDFTVQNPMQKKKIIILSSGGGGGHMAASKAIELALQDKYNVKTVKLFVEVCNKLDPIRKITNDKYNCEDFYNYLLRNRYNRCLNSLGNWGGSYMNSHPNKLKKILIPYFEKEKPDLVISVIPYINNILLDIFSSLNIPFIIIPTDIDVRTFFYNIHQPKYDKFLCGLGYKDSYELVEKDIQKEKVRIIGYPLRSSFFEKKDLNKIKEEFSIPKDKHLVMILMGAVGSSSIKDYVKNLSKSKHPMHLIICIGRNEKIRKELEKIKFPKHITISIIGFTDRISDLMAISDVIITKSGTSSFCEAIQTNLPILLDNTGGTNLKWEKFNFHFIKKHNLGSVITGYKQTVPLVEKIITDEKYKQSIIKNGKKFVRKNFEDQVRKLTDEILNPKKVSHAINTDKKPNAKDIK